MVDSEIEGAPAEMKFVDEFVMQSTEELKAQENWGNLHPIILQAGRCTHAEPVGEDQDDIDAKKAKLEEEDPTVDRFREANAHKGMPGTGPTEEEQKAWLTKIVGDPQPYNAGGEGNVLTYCAVVVRSLRWPGAITVAKGDKFSSVYVGNGLKRGDACFSPTEPPEVLKDPQDQVEQPEPTPLTAPEEPLEDDTDKEEVEGDEQD